MKFTLGRDLDNHFVVENGTVSGYHAEIEVEEGQPMTIKDLDSSNGTYLNGMEIAAKSIYFTDQLVLGTYAVNMEQLKKEIETFVLNNKLDFSKEFRALKPDFERYNKKVNAVHRNQKIKPLLVRLTLTVVIVATLFFLLKDQQELRYPLMTLTGVLGGIFSGMVFNEGKKKRKLEELEIEYAAKLCCPKCKKELYRKSWNYWRQKGACPKCNSSWKNA